MNSIKWISVLDNYPEEWEAVLCLAEDGQIFVGDYSGLWCSRNHEKYRSFILTKEVTHWMPLPKPPNLRNDS